MYLNIDMGQKSSKIESDLNLIPELETENEFKKKNRQLEPDTIGAKLATKAKSIIHFDQDFIYR